MIKIICHIIKLSSICINRVTLKKSILFFFKFIILFNNLCYSSNIYKERKKKVQQTEKVNKFFKVKSCENSKIIRKYERLIQLFFYLIFLLSSQSF